MTGLECTVAFSSIIVSELVTLGTWRPDGSCSECTLLSCLLLSLLLSFFLVAFGGVTVLKRKALGTIIFRNDETGYKALVA